MLRAFFLFTFMVTGTRAFAFNCMHRGLQEQVKDLITPVAIVEPEEGDDRVELGRRLVEQYAKDKGKAPNEILQRFSATGVLKCGDWYGGASLVNNSTTIVTSAHMFVTKPKDKKDCVNHHTPDQCTFTVKTPAGETETPVGSAIEIGFKCPDAISGGDDWAILKLTAPVKGVKHYRTPRADEIVKPRDSVIAVNARNRDIFVDKGNQRIYPKTFEDCETKKPYRNFGKITEIESTCDSSEMTSGSSLVAESGEDDVLVGITTGNYERTADSSTAIANGVRTRKKYSPKEWGSVHVAINGRLLKVLNEQ